MHTNSCLSAWCSVTAVLHPYISTQITIMLCPSYANKLLLSKETQAWCSITYKSTRVVVSHCLGVAKGLKKGVGFQDDVFHSLQNTSFGMQSHFVSVFISVNFPPPWKKFGSSAEGMATLFMIWNTFKHFADCQRTMTFLWLPILFVEIVHLQTEHTKGRLCKRLYYYPMHWKRETGPEGEIKGEGRDKKKSER